MVKYCFDTSGLSTPNEQTPPDIHVSMWENIRRFIADGHVGVTLEIFEEMVNIDGGLGEFIGECKDVILFEIGEEEWNWGAYLDHTNRMQDVYQQFISEFTGGSQKTICLNDISIIALAKTLGVPLLSMETKVPNESQAKRRIPNICESEGVDHVDIREFLRAEGFTF